MKSLAIITTILFYSCVTYSQDFSWWNDMHNWDGVSPWTKYLIISPAYMGPNALPVPEIERGKINNKPFLQIAGENHYSVGDNTINLFTACEIPLYSDKASLAINIVPIEYYAMNEKTRDERKARDKDGKGFAGGDFYFGTKIQLVKDHFKIPDLLITINFKTASGTNLSAVRFTDSPGYYFDLSSGKDLKSNFLGSDSMRIFAAIGFYSWQINDDIYMQDDAFMYGAGINFVYPSFEMTHSAGGFIGYLNNGDRPVVYRFSVKRKTNSNVNLFFRLQQGLNDFKYTTFRIGCEIGLSKLFQNLNNKIHNNKSRN